MPHHDPVPIRHKPEVPPDYAAFAEVIIDEGVRIVETAGNNPRSIITQFKNAGIIVIQKCTTIRHAKSALKLGVDLLSIYGYECAGHVGEHDITNFILLSRARQELGVPFIASSRFADGNGLAAALALGAEGIKMDTRFMSTVEVPIHYHVKDAIINAQETDTALILRRLTNTSRMFSKKVPQEALAVEKANKTGKFSEIVSYVSGKRGREVFLDGDVEQGLSYYLIHICSAPEDAFFSISKSCRYGMLDKLLE
ncbi:Aldolase-type TIM barrel [Penicillium brevicompactum]|uniref:Aldolase-type TIM barrel n=1 Tax=Penicillium brevicompactum TaxID=5074 RepID=A0A9W9Q850_PENBR|nr:Aldolase-type TIM barrel [Penicillium brevicompactum]